MALHRAPWRHVHHVPFTSSIVLKSSWLSLKARIAVCLGCRLLAGSDGAAELVHGAGHASVRHGVQQAFDCLGERLQLTDAPAPHQIRHSENRVYLLQAHAGDLRNN